MKLKNIPVKLGAKDYILFAEPKNKDIVSSLYSNNRHFPSSQNWWFDNDGSEERFIEMCKKASVFNKIEWLLDASKQTDGEIFIIDSLSFPIKNV